MTLATITMAALMTVTQAQRAGEILEYTGSAELITADGERAAVDQVGQGIAVGDTLVTEAGASVKLILRGNNVLTIGPKSRLVISKSMFEDGVVSTAVNLVTGKLRALIGGIFGRRVEFDAKTPNAVAGVRGTYLLVEASEQGSSFYSLNGPVEVTTPNGSSVTLTAGQGVTAGVGGLGAVGAMPQGQLTGLMAGTRLPVRLSTTRTAGLMMPELSEPSAPVIMAPPLTSQVGVSPLALESPPPAQPQGIQVYIDFGE